MLKDIYKFSLTNSKCYSWLDDLSNKIGQRISGSVGAEKGVAYVKAQLETLGLDKVYLQEVMVPKWVTKNTLKTFQKSETSWINHPDFFH